MLFTIVVIGIPEYYPSLNNRWFGWNMNFPVALFSISHTYVFGVCDTWAILEILMKYIHSFYDAHIRWSAVITRFIITTYCTHHSRNRSRTSNRGWIHKRHQNMFDKINHNITAPYCLLQCERLVAVMLWIHCAPKPTPYYICKYAWIRPKIILMIYFSFAHGQHPNYPNQYLANESLWSGD